MKTLKIAMMVLTIGAAAVFAAPLEWFDMNDSAGTDLNDLSNSGTLGSVWNFNTPGMLTDGSGNFIIAGDGGTTTRKLPKKATANAHATLDQYASPLTTGAYSLDLNVTSWSWDAASEGDLWKLKAQNLAGVDVAGIEVGLVGGNARVRMWSLGESNAYYRTFNYTGLTDSSGHSYSVEIDFDNDTIDYVVDGTTEYSFTDFAGTELAGLVLSLNGDGTADWATAASSISIDSMGVDVIPEPATVGMIGLGGAIALVIRRFRDRS